jgi:hypothetical protein
MSRHRYVILRHELPPGIPRASHWDLMLESGPELPLLTWAWDELPRADQSVMGLVLEPHRRDYLEYEGEISGGRGRVWRWDEGNCRLTIGTWSDLVLEIRHAQGEKRRAGDASSNSAPEFTLRLEGRRLSGTLELRPVPHNRGSGEVQSAQFWKFSFVGSIAVR